MASYILNFYRFTAHSIFNICKQTEDIDEINDEINNYGHS